MDLINLFFGIFEEKYNTSAVRTAVVPIRIYFLYLSIQAYLLISGAAVTVRVR